MIGLPRLFLLMAAMGMAAPPLPAQIYADFDVGTTIDPSIPGPLSFSVFLDTTTGLSDIWTTPQLVANFIRLAEGEDSWVDSTTGLVEKKPFFDGLTFYRLIDNTRIDFGSRNGTGTDGPGYELQDDFHSNVSTSFALYMDNDGPNTNGCRYFISWNNPSLDTDRYSRLGSVLQTSSAYPGFNGRLNVAAISSGAADENGFATDPEPINSVTIRRVGTLAEAFEEDWWQVPDVSSSGFRIEKIDSTWRLNWSDEPGTVAQYFGSSDLVTWFAFEDYNPPGQVALGADITASVETGSPGFYRGASIHYPEWPAADFALYHAGLTFQYLTTSPNQINRISLNFNITGIGGTWTRSHSSGGPLIQDGFGTFSGVWSTSKPFLGEFMILQAPGLPPSEGFPPYPDLPYYTFRLHFDHHLPVEEPIDRFEAFTTAPPFEGFAGEWTYTELPH